MKRKIRLTESNLKQIIAETVEEVLSEADWKTYMNASRKAAEKAAEEQRKKDEAAKKAAEEALAKKNAQLKKEIDAVNDEIMQGKVALNSGNINSALEHFEKAQKNLPVSDGEPAFSGSKYSEIAVALYNAAEKASGDDKERLKSTALI